MCLGSRLAADLSECGPVHGRVRPRRNRRHVLLEARLRVVKTTLLHLSCEPSQSALTLPHPPHCA
jgi:hypothetical protein